MKNKLFSWNTKKYFYVKPKLLFNLKLSFILTVFCLNASIFASAQKVTFEVRNKRMTDVLKEITRKTGVNFFYNNTVFDDTRTVSYNASNSEVLDVVNRLIGSNYRAVFVDQNVIAIEVVAVSKTAEAVQEIKIEGIVSDAKGNPLPGVIVSIKDDVVGVLADANGHYELNVRKGNVIIFSFLGYKKQEITIKDNKAVINVVLEESQVELESVKVVNTGYQTLSKARNAGAFSKADMKIVESRSYSMNILQRLDGIVAGLTVNNNINASANPFLVRGLTTIGTFDKNGNSSGGTNRNPLYVVDGIPIDNISSINPQDVQNVTVLKDATASSIWGARAANGVIVLTTKKGKKGSKLSIEYDAFSNFEGRPDLGYQKYLNSPQFIQAAKETFFPDEYSWEQAIAYNYGGSGVPPHLRILYNQSRGLISEAEANSRLAGLARIDNSSQIKNLFYRSAILSNHTLSLSGGTDNYSFYTSATYTNNQNSTPGDEDRLYKLNARQDFKINNFISAYAITDFSKSKLSSKRNLDLNYGFYPYQLFRDKDGKNLSMSYMTNLSDEVRTDFEERSRISLDYNPLDEFNRGSTDTDGFMSRIIGGINVNIIDGLKFVGTYGYIVGSNKTSIFDSQDSYTVRKELVEFTVADNPHDTPDYYLPSTGGRYSEANASQKNYTIRNQFEYDKGWNDEKHHINILFGHEAQENSTQSTTTLVRGYDPLLQTYSYINYETLVNDGINNPVMPNSGARSFLGIDQPRDFVQTDILSRFMSYFSNASYTLNNKYSLNGSIRKDQSNLFALDKSSQSKPVWSVGGKWQVSGESFLYDSSVVSNLALRATYGVTGNAPSPGTAASYDILMPQTEYAVVGNVIPLTIATPGNKRLIWESTKNINLGLDFSLFLNRIDGSIDFYRKNTENMIGQLPLNIFTGYVSAIGNFGSMENKGVEITLNALNVETKDFSWSTQFVMSYNKNKITELELPSQINTGDQKVEMSYMKGYPAYAVFAYDYQGLDASGDPLIKLADGTITKTPNITTADDIVYKGTLAPKWNGGLTNVFTYKRLTLSGTAVYNLGHVMRKDVNSFYNGPLIQGNLGFRRANLHSDFADRWKNPGDELVTDIPRYVPQASIDGDDRSTNYYTLGSTTILDASYIKFRDITLAYSLPKTVLDRANISSLSFRISMSNVMLWKANKEGIDPEFQADQVRYPKTGQNAIAFGLHLSL